MAEKNARSLNAEMAGSILEKGGFLLKETHIRRNKTLLG